MEDQLRSLDETPDKVKVLYLQLFTQKDFHRSMDSRRFQKKKQYYCCSHLERQRRVAHVCCKSLVE